jgi:uncharacterized protein (TIGR03118 family)
MRMFQRIRHVIFPLLLPALAHAQTSNSYTQKNLTSDGSVTAQQTDKTLINPWGVAIGQQTPFWINSAGSGLSEVYDSGGNKQFVVKIPAVGGSTKTGTPTGIAFNSSTTDFVLNQGSPALFVFDALDGTISAWNSSLTDAQVMVDNSASGAVYTGLAIDSNSSGNFILAANLTANTIDVFDTKFAPTSLSGKFSDPTLPHGYAPFNVHIFNGQVYVMYALQTAGGGPPTPGAGAGYINVFDGSGNLLKRAISGGNLNVPWGVAIAPASFGAFGGNLLVGNFGDGTINAYDASTFALKGQLQDTTGKPITNDRLWEILFGQNGTGDPGTLYFSAGVNNEKGGLFGSITATSPVIAGDFQLNVSTPVLTVAQGVAGTIQVSVAPTNGFSAPVSLSVSGLPTGLTFQFSPSSVTPSAGQAASATLTISAGASTAPSPSPSPYIVSSLGSSHISQIARASALFPIGLACLLPMWTKRRRALKYLRICGGSLSLLAIMVTLGGCSASKTPSTSPTPVAAGTSTVTVSATSGAVTHTTTFSLTVQ